MESPRHAFAIALFCLITPLARASDQPATTYPVRSIVPHAVPAAFSSGERFAVTVNGINVPVFRAGLNVFFAGFDFAGAADVRVAAAEVNGSLQDLWRAGSLPDEPPATRDFWKGRSVVRPTSAGVAAKTAGNVVTFTLNRPGQYSVEPPGLMRHSDEVLLLFANAPDGGPQPVRPHDPSLIHLAPGVHVRDINLESGQTLYLDAGAVLYGAVNVWDAHDVTIAGRGVVVFDHPMSRDTDNGPPNRPNQHPLTTHNVNNLTIRGVTFVNLRRTWSLQLHTTTGLLADNIKVLSLNPANANGDGIDWLDGGDATVRNSLIRAADDCFAFFAAASVNANGWAQLARGAPSIPGTVRNVTIDHCVVWSTYANILRVGWVRQSLSTDHVTMRNCDVLHVSHHPAPQVRSWSLLAVSPTGITEPSRHANYLFDDIRFEESFGLIDLQAKSADLQDFTFRNITMSGDARPLYRGGLNYGSVEGFVFDHVMLNGKTVAGLNDL